MNQIIQSKVIYSTIDFVTAIMLFSCSFHFISHITDLSWGGIYYIATTEGEIILAFFVLFRVLIISETQLKLLIEVQSSNGVMIERVLSLKENIFD